MNTRRRVAFALALLFLAAPPDGVWARISIPGPQTEREAAPGWIVEQDPFADLWFHGLAVLGFDGFGPIPLYDPEYVAAAAAHRVKKAPLTPLESARGRLLAHFAGDPAFEVLHFVPLYFSGVPGDQALDAMGRLGADHHHAEHGVVRLDRAGRVSSALASTLPASGHRDLVREYVSHLQHERPVLEGFERSSIDVAAIRAAWRRLATGPVGSFLQAEGFDGGRIIVTSAIGLEGRLLAEQAGPVVVVGATSQSDARAVAGASLRELCYPTVRRVLAPYEARIGDRERLSVVSHHVATRCAARLLEAYAPDFLPAFAERFGAHASDAGFLSAAGLEPGVATLQRDLDQALTRELNLESNGPDSELGPVRR